MSIEINAANQTAAYREGYSDCKQAVRDAVREELQQWCPNASDEIHRFAEALLTAIDALGTEACKTCGGRGFIGPAGGFGGHPICRDCTGKAGTGAKRVECNTCSICGAAGQFCCPRCETWHCDTHAAHLCRKADSTGKAGEETIGANDAD